MKGRADAHENEDNGRGKTPPGLPWDKSFRTQTYLRRPSA